MTSSNLAQLRAAWVQAKTEEQRANERRLQIEAAILEHFTPPDSLEGTVSNKSEGISVAYKLTRTADTAALQKAWVNLPSVVQDAFEWKATPIMKNIKALQIANPEAYAIAAEFITAKPAKPYITVK